MSRKESLRRYRENNPEKVLESARRYRRNNPEKVRDSDVRSHLKRKYGITLEEYTQRVSDQGNVCAICQQECITGRLAVDHNHETGQIRALLCLNCNNGLGRFKDSPERLRAAAAYVEAHNGKN